jgi:hypothetical protein
MAMNEIVVGSIFALLVWAKGFLVGWWIGHNEGKMDAKVERLEAEHEALLQECETALAMAKKAREAEDGE